MEQGAIKRIEELIAAGADLPDTDYPAVALPGDTSLQGLEKFEAAPYRMRARFETERVPDFIEYVKEQHVHGETAVFIEPDGSGGTGVIDYGTHEVPKWGSHRAVLSMERTHEYAALLNAARSPMSQREITDWIEDWQHVLQPFRGEEDLAVGRVVQSLRRVDIKASLDTTHEEGDWSGKRTSMEQVEAKSGDQSMPDGFRFTTSLFRSTHPRVITVRTSLLTGDDKPRFRMRIVGQEALEREVAQEIEDRIKSELSAVRVFVGSVG